MLRARYFSLVVFAIASWPISLRAGYIDSINAAALPPSNATESIYWASNGQGWYYTPTFNYTLTGVFTNFAVSKDQSVTPLITVQIQTDRPVNGGSVLASGAFQGNSSEGGIEGAALGPINLTAGHTYFVDFLNDLGMGANIGLWQSVNGVPTPSDGATINLGTEYYDLTPSTGFAGSNGNGDYSTNFGTNGFPVMQSSGAEPILLFAGTVPTPEPSSILLLIIGGCAAAVMVGNRRRTPRPFHQA